MADHAGEDGVYGQGQPRDEPPGEDKERLWRVTPAPTRYRHSLPEQRQRRPDKRENDEPDARLDERPSPADHRGRRRPATTQATIMVKSTSMILSTSVEATDRQSKPAGSHAAITAT